MADWDVYRTILAIAREGSLLKASRVLGVNNATAGRHLKQIEDALDAKLFDRMSNGLHPTEAGKAAIETALRIEHEVEASNRILLGTNDAMSGEIRLSVPLNVMPYGLADVLGQFVAQHPDIYLKVNSTDSPVDFLSREVDIVVRASNDLPDGLWRFWMAELSFGFYATSAFLAQWQDQMDAEPETVPLPYIELNDTAPWRDREQLLRVYPNARAVADVNVIDSVLPLVRAGLATGRLGRFIGDYFDDLHCIVPCEPKANRTLWVLTHPDFRGTRKFRTLMEFIRDEFAKRSGQPSDMMNGAH